MGVNSFLLDRRTAKLLIGGSSQTVGTLRRFFKLTELDEERAGEREAAEDAAQTRPSPAAAMIMDVWDLPLASAPGTPVAAHLCSAGTRVGGVSLGYAVRDPVTQEYTLHVLKDDLLYSIDVARARDLGLLDSQDGLVRHGQPVITECANVRPFLDSSTGMRMPIAP